MLVQVVVSAVRKAGLEVGRSLARFALFWTKKQGENLAIFFLDYRDSVFRASRRGTQLLAAGTGVGATPAHFVNTRSGFSAACGVGGWQSRWGAHRAQLCGVVVPPRLPNRTCAWVPAGVAAASTAHWVLGGWPWAQWPSWGPRGPQGSLR